MSDDTTDREQLRGIVGTVLPAVLRDQFVEYACLDAFRGEDGTFDQDRVSWSACRRRNGWTRAGSWPTGSRRCCPPSRAAHSMPPGSREPGCRARLWRLRR